MTPTIIREQLEDDKRNHRATALTSIAALVSELLDAQREVDVGVDPETDLTADRAAIAEFEERTSRERRARLDRAEDAVRTALGLPSREQLEEEDASEYAAVALDLQELGVSPQDVLDAARAVAQGDVGDDDPVGSETETGGES